MGSDNVPRETFFNLNEEKQENIMRAAIKEFINNGFEKGNVGNIAKSAAVAKGSMYQYFDDKKELFQFAVKWSIELLIKKYNKYINIEDKNMNVFDFFMQSSKEIWLQMKEDRDLTIFVQDVFLGKYGNIANESIEYMTKISDQYVLAMIRDGKRNGYIRQDIDDDILCLFMTGVSTKIKEHMMSKARKIGEDIIDEDFEKNEIEIKAMLELLKNGMGA